jgi:DNA-binding protein H-NS
MKNVQTGQYDLSIYNFVELENLRCQVDAAMPQAKSRELAALREKINKLVVDSGLESLDELFKKNIPKGKKSKSQKKAIKFIHPSNPELTWTGMGRHPKWLSEWLKAGNSLSSCSVND